MYRIVLDPVTLLRGLLNPHSPCRLLLFDYADRYHALFSDETVRVVRILVLHPILVVGLPSLVKINHSRLTRILLRAERVSIPAEHDDNLFVAVARAAQADYLVCEDRNLLARRDQLGVPVIDAATFLSLLDPDRIFDPEPVGAGGLS